MYAGQSAHPPVKRRSVSAPQRPQGPEVQAKFTQYRNGFCQISFSSQTAAGFLAFMSLSPFLRGLSPRVRGLSPRLFFCLKALLLFGPKLSFRSAARNPSFFLPVVFPRSLPFAVVFRFCFRSGLKLSFRSKARNPSFFCGHALVINLVTLRRCLTLPCRCPSP